MRRNWVTKFRRGLLLTALAGAGIGLVGCADEYAGYPGYHGGYYASYSAPYPYYGGYGYPSQAYGPYYGRPYGYGYGGPYYGGSSVVVSRSSSSYRYRDQNGRWHDRRGVNRNTNRVRSNSNTTTRSRTRVPQSENDDEQRYYGPRTR